MTRFRTVVLSLGAAIGCFSCGGNNGGASYDGTWQLTVSISSCYSFTHTVPITISDGLFSGPLFQYCTVATSGATRLSADDCLGDIAQDVSVENGEVDGEWISGNLFLAGDACNGGNGFSGTFTDKNNGSASSYWGTLSFKR